MPTTQHDTESGIVRVTNMATRTLYFQGRYYRTTLTVAITPTNFRMISRATYTGHPTALRWFWTDDKVPTAAWFYSRFDYSRVTEEAPF